MLATPPLNPRRTPTRSFLLPSRFIKELEDSGCVLERTEHEDSERRAPHRSHRAAARYQRSRRLNRPEE